MARYDWPSSPETGDDPMARGRYNQRHLPPPAVRPADGAPLPPLPASLAIRTPAPRSRRARRPAIDRAQPAGGQHLWNPIGPSTLVAGQATGRPRVAGRVKGIAVEPVKGDRLYAASATGGVWFSGDRGVSWTPLNEFAMSPNRTTPFPVGNTLATGAIHVKWGGADVDDGASDEVIVGTGEPGGSGGIPGGQLVGIGVLRATGPATGAAWVPEANALRGEAIWRIVHDPGNDDQQFAATTDGLYACPPPPRTGDVWSKVAGPGLTPGILPIFDKHVLDVAVTRLTGPDRVRIWIARYSLVQYAEISGAAATTVPLNLAGLAFTNISPPNVLPGTRMVLSVAADGDVYVLGRRKKIGTEPLDPAHLWRINAGEADPTKVAATEIPGLPLRLFQPEKHDQSSYDMTMLTHPDHAGVLFVAGSAVLDGGEWNGAFYRVTVAGTTATSEFVGKGVHSDCHALEIGPAPSSTSTDRAVWIGCDGGVFLSDRDGGPGTFVPRNSGLAVLQPGFVACHPTNDGIVAAGLQDNGTVERAGDTVWREPFLGDGGGIVYDPTHDRRFLRQYINAYWASSDHTGIAPVFRRDASAPEGQQTSEQVENGAALFYSGADAIAHGGTTHLALGTDRVWYSTDWGQSWVTLPTGTDPRAADRPDLAQDVLQPGAANGRYTDTVRTFLCCHKDYHGTLQGGTGILTCRWSARTDDGGNHRIRLLALWNGGLTIMEGSRATSSTGAWSFTTAATEEIRLPAAGTEQTDVDSANATNFLPAPDLVNDVVPHDPTTGARGSCYVATIGGPGSGAGHEIDTVFWYDGDGKFWPAGLRRSIPTRGVWTGDQIPAPALSLAVDPDDRSLVYVGTSVGVVQGTFTVVDNGSGPEPHWAWTPFDNGLPEGAVHDLAIYSHDGLKLLRAALQARGVWEVDLSPTAAVATTYLRAFPSDSRRRRPTPLTGDAVKGEPGVRWDASPDIVFDTTGNVVPVGGPSEADLFETPFAGRVGSHAAQELSNRTFKVHVLVHHRWLAAAQPADVRVALLRHEFPDADSEVALGGIWSTLVSVGGGGALPPSLAGGWLVADVQTVRPIPAPIDTRTPRAVSFDVDLTALPDDSRLVFLAVVMSAADPLTAEEIHKDDGEDAATVDELVQWSRHAAARTLRVT